MREVRVSLRFITPCLGNKRSVDQPDKMLRDAAGSVVFISTWWSIILTYGARALSKHQAQIRTVSWDQKVKGVTSVYRRYYTETDYTEHEAFDTGSVIQVNALLPESIPLEDFEEILRIAGTYKGISPYGHDKGFGRFELISAEVV